MLYRPLTGNMGSKFVSAGSSEDLSHDKPSKEALLVREREIPFLCASVCLIAAMSLVSQDAHPDAVRAAQLKMFGKLTHERVEWHPARMLCIRCVWRGLQYDRLSTPTQYILIPASSS